MNKSIKILFTTLFVLGITLLLTGVSFAWFNYRKETADQQLIAGDIYFNLVEGDGEIELSNLFPETASEARSRTDNYITFNVKGKNTSNKTIYYEFILNHGEDKASPKSRYNDSDLRFDLVELDSNGNELDYLLSAVSYETLVNTSIYDGEVSANTSSEVIRYFKLRMWLDENVLISDSEPSANYSTEDFPNKYATVKLVVTGDFIEKASSKSLYTIMRNSSLGLDTENGVDFNKTSEHDGLNGEGTNGVYTIASTVNDTYPIYYYRGAVEDNNVLFGNKCWKMVRTTETGGTKLLYNGVPSYNKRTLTRDEYSEITTNTANFTFDETDNSWNTTLTSTVDYNSPLEFGVKLQNTNDYYIVISGKVSSNTDAWVESDVNYDGNYAYYYVYGDTDDSLNLRFKYHVSNDKILSFDIYGDNSTVSSPSTIKIQLLVNDETLEIGCDNYGAESLISSDSYRFNNYTNSPAYVGYMYGTVYTPSTSGWVTGARFGKSFTWDGTNYKLVDDTVTTPDSTHHYSCNVTTVGGTCTSIRYVDFVSGSDKYYFTFTGGDGAEEALAKMFTNTNNSNVKNIVDNWYASNMTSYTDKIEDTVWCNDRSFGDNNNNGWIPNGGDLSTELDFGPRERSGWANAASTQKNKPTLLCVNKNDRFTVNNIVGNKALTYPIGLLTFDEVAYAGMLTSDAFQNNSTYINHPFSTWTMSPGFWYYSNSTTAYPGNFYTVAWLHNVKVTEYFSIRPAISVKPGLTVTSGDGSVNTPYVIE